jgi:drug/metabolite transporter (DMT)-like permease
MAVLLVGTVFGAFGAMYLNLGAKKARLEIKALMRNRKLTLGVVLYGLSFLPYLYALRQLPLSIAYPMTSMTYIWSAFLATKYLNERIDVWRWSGITAIVIGITLLGAS